MSAPDSTQSSYLVIARKYRPQLFEEIVGQDATARTLRNAIEQRRIAHAYLFAGVRGVGKTTTARILAKALNCLQGPTVTPCNQCDSCREITGGNSIDVIEIDAASNRGIDEIRELRENVKYRPARDRHKIFIIDEVHMLTTEAFNALLKTLEEPPEHVVFILATTELHKVPATILSRCQHFNFRAIDRQAILARLEEIARHEGIEISSTSLNDLITASEGSMRDAQSLLDQVISFCGKKVEEGQVRDMLGVIPQEILLEFTRAIAESDSRQIILLVDQLIQTGRNLQQFIRDLLTHFRHLLMLRIAGPDPKLIPLSHEDLTKLQDWVGRFSEEDFLRFFNILSFTEGELRWTSQPRFHLEIGLLKLAQAKRLVPLEKLLEGLRGLSTQEPSKPEEDLEPEELEDDPGIPEAPALPRSEPAFQSGTAPRASTPSVPPTGSRFKTAIAKQSLMLGSLLDHAMEIKLTGDTVQIGFAPNQQFYAEMLQSQENQELLRKVAAELAGKPVNILIVRMEAAADNSGSSLPPEVSSKKELINRMKKETPVKAFLETFDGEITDVKEIGENSGQ
jgi:DNA polymerase-3 subunit gamma/tau